MSKLTQALKYYGILALSYLALAMLLPANHAAQRDYHLSSSAYHALVFLVILPLIGIWLGAFYSYARLQQYSEAIADTSQGDDFQHLTTGFQWLAWGSAATSLLSMALNAIANIHPGFIGFSIIVVNYASLIVPLVAYSYISTGARGLNINAKISISGYGVKALSFGFMLLGVTFCFLTFRHLNIDSLGSTQNPYYLPPWLIILTIIVPYLYTWFIGLLAAYEIYLYGKHSEGVLYQHAIRQLSFGVIAVIASSIVVQYLRSAIPRSGHLSLNTILMLINVIYIFMAIGYIFLSLGARQLRKIEEV